MLDRQSKNIIKAVVAVLLSVVLGEGVFGLGFFWPFLLILLDWKWIYWFSLFIGLLLSGFYRIPMGLPSFFLVVVVGGLSFLISSRKETGWVMLVISLVANLVFDKVFGLSWNYLDIIFIVVAWLIAQVWFEKTESIKINY